MNRDEIERKASAIYSLYEKPEDKFDLDNFLEQVKQACPEVIAAVMAKLSSTGAMGQTLNALRDSCNAILQAKLSTNIITTMERLDKTATFLTWVGIALAVMIGVAQIAVPLVMKK